MDYLKGMGFGTPSAVVQKALIAVDPESGFVKKNLTQEEINEISAKLNGDDGSEPKERKVRKERAPLNETEKEVIRLRFALGRVKKAKANKETPRPQDLETIKNGGKLPAGVAPKVKATKKNERSVIIETRKADGTITTKIDKVSTGASQAAAIKAMRESKKVSTKKGPKVLG
jgi:hypothetical protein